MYRIRIGILFGILVLAAVAFWGCEGDQGPEGPAGIQGPAGPTELNVVAVYSIFTEPDKAFNKGYFVMSVYNAPSIPKVILDEMSLRPDGEWMFGGGRLAYYSYHDLERTDSSFLNLTWTKMTGATGSASAKISLPSEFYPVDNNIYVLIGDDVEAEWDRSPGAGAYWIYSYFYFDFYDSTDTRRMMYLELDTVLAGNDTTLLVSGSDIFPDLANINGIAGFDGYFYVRAVSGPWLPGEADNFTGDAFGVFVAATDPIFIDVDLAPTKSSLEIEDKPVIDRSRIDELFNRRVAELSPNQNR